MYCKQGRYCTSVILLFPTKEQRDTAGMWVQMVTQNCTLGYFRRAWVGPCEHVQSSPNQIWWEHILLLFKLFIAF